MRFNFWAELTATGQARTESKRSPPFPHTAHKQGIPAYILQFQLFLRAYGRTLISFPLSSSSSPFQFSLQIWHEHLWLEEGSTFFNNCCSTTAIEESNHYCIRFGCFLCCCFTHFSSRYRSESVYFSYGEWIDQFLCILQCKVRIARRQNRLLIRFM